MQQASPEPDWLKRSKTSGADPWASDAEARLLDVGEEAAWETPGIGEWSEPLRVATTEAQWASAASPRGDIVLGAVQDSTCLLSVSHVSGDAGSASRLLAERLGTCGANAPAPPTENAWGRLSVAISNDGFGLASWMVSGERQLAWLGGLSASPSTATLLPAMGSEPRFAASSDQLAVAVSGQDSVWVVAADSARRVPPPGTLAHFGGEDDGQTVLVVAENPDGERVIERWAEAAWETELTLPLALQSGRLVAFRATSDGGRLVIAYEDEARSLVLGYRDPRAGWSTARIEGATDSPQIALGRFGALVGFEQGGTFRIFSNAPGSACALGAASTFGERPWLVRDELALFGDGDLVLHLALVAYHPVAVLSGVESTQAIVLDGSTLNRELRPLRGRVLAVGGGREEIVLALQTGATDTSIESLTFWKAALPPSLAPCAR